MEQSPTYKVHRTSDNRGIPRILWKSETHYRVQKSPPLEPTLCQFLEDPF
jgi:hypothetical protein